MARLLQQMVERCWREGGCERKGFIGRSCGVALPFVTRNGGLARGIVKTDRNQEIQAAMVDLPPTR